MFLKKKNNNDIHEFHPLIVEIEDRPVNPAGRLILWLILSVITFGILWLFFAKIDVVVSARGQVIPSGEIKVLQPIETGVISKILIKEGDFVKKGATLMQIDPSVTETSLEAKQKDFEVITLQIKRLESLINEKVFDIQVNNVFQKEQLNLYTIQKNSFKEMILKYDLQLKQIESQYKSAVSQTNSFRQLLEIDTKRAKRLEKVLDIIATKEYDELLKNITNNKEQLLSAKLKTIELQSKKSEIEEEKSLYINEFKDKKLEELLSLQKEARNLESQINAIHFQNQKQSIKAPADGYISKIMINTIGGVVTPAEKLISMVPKNSPLIVKANVLNQDIGFVKNSMQSKIKIDTFSFQKYGFFQGEVINVGSYSIKDEQLGDIYEVKIQPDGKTINVEGEERYLEAGMSVTTEIKVGKRRVIEFFIYPIIKYLDEGMSVR